MIRVFYWQSVAVVLRFPPTALHAFRVTFSSERILHPLHSSHIPVFFCVYVPDALVLRVRELPTRASRVRAARTRLSVRERQHRRGLLGNQKRTHTCKRGGVSNPAFQDI